MALSREEAEQILSLAQQMYEKMDQRDEEAKKLGAAFQETKNTLNTINDRITEIETKDRKPWSGTRVATNGKSQDDIDPAMLERKSLFINYVRKGWFGMDKTQHEKMQELLTQAPEGMQAKMTELRREMKAFSITDDTLGGYFVVPQIITDEIIKNAVLYSPVRELANVVQTSNNSVRLPVRTGSLSAGWVSETGTRAESLGQAYGMKEIPTHEMYALLIFSRQLLEDAFFNLDNELNIDAAEQFGVVEGSAFVNGDGNGKPFGFVTDTNIAQVLNGGATASYDGLVKLLHSLKRPYRQSRNLRFAMNVNAIRDYRLLKDTQQRPLWEPSVPNGNPANILGVPYVEVPDMVDIAASSLSVACGDFSRGYRFVDRVTVVAQRLDELYAISGQVGLLLHKRVGGQVVLPEAIKLLKFA